MFRVFKTLRVFWHTWKFSNTDCWWHVCHRVNNLGDHWIGVLKINANTDSFGSPENILTTCGGGLLIQWENEWSGRLDWSCTVEKALVWLKFIKLTFCDELKALHVGCHDTVMTHGINSLLSPDWPLFSQQSHDYHKEKTIILKLTFIKYVWVRENCFINALSFCSLLQLGLEILLFWWIFKTLYWI